MSSTPSEGNFKFKSINSLVPDIYSFILGEGEYEGLTEKDAKILGSLLGDVIADRLERNRTERSPAQDGGKFQLRMSNYGMKARKLWFEANLPKGSGKQRTAEDYLNFLIGDIWETIALFLAYKSGHVVEHRQKEVTLEGIPGHIDVVIDGVTVDVKSASGWSYDNKFEKGGLYKGEDSFNYLPQILGYKQEMGTDEAAFLVVNKEKGKFFLSKVPKEVDEAIVPSEIAKKAQETIKLSAPPEEKCYEPTEDGSSGNKILNKNCSFCVFKFRCWQETANNGEGLRAFRYANGVKYFTEVVKAPKVEEITDLLNPLAMQDEDLDD